MLCDNQITSMGATVRFECDCGGERVAEMHSRYETDFQVHCDCGEVFVVSATRISQ